MTSKFKKFFLMCIVTVFFVTGILSFYPYYCSVNAITYRYGSQGNTVTEIQSRLKRWGYYNGSVDGHFGYQTYLAVKGFQRKNGLTADGVVGDKTLQALGIMAAPSRISTNQDVALLARVINGEARGEPYIGQVAVGAVILNRVDDSRFPKSLAGVIYQPGAFTAIADGQINAPLEQSSINAARDAINGWDPSSGAVYYYNPAKTTNQWIYSRPIIKVIGSHRFCR